LAATLPAGSFQDKSPMERTSPPGGPQSRRRVLPWADQAFSVVAHSAAIVTLLLLFGIIVSLFIGAMPAIREFGFGFFTSTEWDPVQLRFGGLVMIYGTLMTSIIALLIAVPVSFGIAVFLTELSPNWLKRPMGVAIELLAAVPSIVYGMWGLLVFGPILATYVQQPLQAAFDGVPVLGSLVSGPPGGHRHPVGRHHPGHHGHSLHRGRDARRV
jgi:phosphate transport system permease protein